MFDLDSALAKASKVFIKARKGYESVIVLAEQQEDSAKAREEQAKVDHDKALVIQIKAKNALIKINEIIGDSK